MRATTLPTNSTLLWIATFTTLSGFFLAFATAAATPSAENDAKTANDDAAAAHFQLAFLSNSEPEPAAAAKGAGGSKAAGDATDIRLPELARPIHYDLLIKPYMHNFTFDGYVSILLEILKPTDTLVLHADELKIESMALEIDDIVYTLKENGNNGSWTIDAQKTFVRIQLPGEMKLDAGEAILNISYRGQINDKMRGFSRSSYKPLGGNATTKEFMASTKFEEAEPIEYLASTQFESTYARKAFPCWDEPVYKATFSLVLNVDRKYTAISNMPAIAEGPVKIKTSGGGDSTDKERKLVYFAETPKMSTYLVAWTIGELEYIESSTKANVRVRIYTVPGKKEQGRFALDVATRALDFYNEWFGINMPLPKCDLVAIPDFASGAMENWGMVTYREILLLAHPQRSSTYMLTRIAQVIGHELAHFWFGNLVTMRWWNDLWLKEGFASFMEYVFVGANLPQFNIWPKFLIQEMAQGFDLDGLRSAHPIEVPIWSPTELDAIYDSITYEKSNSVIRMLYEHLGEETFRRGLQIYLNRFQYRNAVTQDLWTALAEASKQDISTLMSSWTRQQGFPVLVCDEHQVDDDKRTLFVRQERFLADGGAEASGNETLWQVPVAIGVPASGAFVAYKFVLGERSGNFMFQGPQRNQSLKVNARTSGFYRVQYSPSMHAALMPAFRPSGVGALAPMDRYGFASDLYALAAVGRVPIGRFLDLVTLAQSVGEDNYVVWTALNHGLAELRAVLDCAVHEPQSLATRFNRFVAARLGPVAESLGSWKLPDSNRGVAGDNTATADPDRALLQAMLLRRLIYAQHDATVGEAFTLFRDNVDKGVPLSADLRQAVFTAVALNNDARGIADIRHMLETVDFSEIERNCIVALGQVTDKEMLADNFKYGVFDGKIRPQDVGSLFAGASLTTVGKHFAWDFFRAQNKKLLEMYGSASSSLYLHIFDSVTENLCTEKDAEDAERFFAQTFDAATQKAIKQKFARFVEKIRVNANLVQRNEQALDAYLRTHGF